MITTDEWKRRILEFFVDRSYYEACRVTRKEEIFESFGSHLDANADIAFISLINDGLILHLTSNGDDFFTIDIFEKREQILRIIQEEDLDTKSEMMQPDESETTGLVHQFTTRGFREYPAQSSYYYYTKQDDDSDWIALHKTKPVGKAHRIILGSFKDQKSRVARIWKATTKIGKDNPDGFRRKQVENIEQQACGNNRLPSKAAFDVFVFKKWLVEEKRGKSTFYKLNTVKPEKESPTKSGLAKPITGRNAK